MRGTTSGVGLGGVDAYGTVAGVLPGKSEETLIIGSHYDSVPNGGRYDGCSGVIAGIRVAQALREEGVVPAYTLMILGLNDEEGVALTEGFLSSRGVCGEIDEAALDRVRHRTTGESLRQLAPEDRKSTRLNSSHPSSSRMPSSA